MNLITKFGLNDVVWSCRQREVVERVTCPACGGEGRVVLKNGPRTCPDCWGRGGDYERRGKEWQVVGPLTIGRVGKQVTNIVSDGEFDNVGHYVKGHEEIETRYMMYETGVGTGQLWDEEELYGTKDEAQAECDRRNHAEETPCSMNG